MVITSLGHATIAASEAAEILVHAAEAVAEQIAVIEATGDYDQLALLRSSGDLEVHQALLMGADALRRADEATE
jgi:hypothetical protein